MVPTIFCFGIVVIIDDDAFVVCFVYSHLFLKNVMTMSRFPIEDEVLTTHKFGLRTNYYKLTVNK